MKDQNKTKKQLIEELTGLRQRILEFDKNEDERKRMEERLREYERVVENSQDMIAAVDKNYKYVVKRPISEIPGFEKRSGAWKVSPRHPR